jgi:hypothetical protein
MVQLPATRHGQDSRGGQSRRNGFPPSRRRSPLVALNPAARRHLSHTPRRSSTGRPSRETALATAAKPTRHKRGHPPSSTLRRGARRVSGLQGGASCLARRPYNFVSVSNGVAFEKSGRAVGAERASRCWDLRAAAPLVPLDALPVGPCRQRRPCSLGGDPRR